MAPLDPESGSFGALAVKTSEAGIAAVVTVFIGWLIAKVFQGKRLAAVERAIEDQPEAMKRAIEEAIAKHEEKTMRRLKELAIRQQEVQQEVFGAHGRGGLTSRVEQVVTDLSTLSRETGEISAKLDVIVDLLKDKSA